MKSFDKKIKIIFCLLDNNSVMLTEILSLVFIFRVEGGKDKKKKKSTRKCVCRALNTDNLGRKKLRDENEKIKIKTGKKSTHASLEI